MTAGAMTTITGQLRYLKAQNTGPKLVPSYMKFGIGSTQITESTTGVEIPIPVWGETVCDDGSNILTGSSGGDNSTDNTTTYKTGAQVTDATAQNLIANNTNATKIWTIADLASAGTNAVTTMYAALWLYIKDATALAKFKSSGTCLELKLGSDASNYYSITKTAADLAVGWNWISSTSLLSAWTETGTVAGNIDTFIIEITTNNATDTFVAGDVIYDILRQWDAQDEEQDLDTDYPSVNDAGVYVEIRARLEKNYAVGFDITNFGVYDENDTYIAGIQLSSSQSKSNLDIFIAKFITRMRNRRVTA